MLARFQGFTDEPGVEMMPNKHKNRLDPWIIQDQSIVGDGLPCLEFPGGMCGGHAVDSATATRFALCASAGSRMERA